jgi:hypothetical protein
MRGRGGEGDVGVGEGEEGGLTGGGGGGRRGRPAMRRRRRLGEGEELGG